LVTAWLLIAVTSYLAIVSLRKSELWIALAFGTYVLWFPFGTIGWVIVVSRWVKRREEEAAANW
jgi:hypothetical protein